MNAIRQLKEAFPASPLSLTDGQPATPGSNPIAYPSPDANPNSYRAQSTALELIRKFPPKQLCDHLWNTAFSSRRYSDCGLRHVSLINSYILLWQRATSSNDPVPQPLYISELTISLVALVSVSLANALFNLPDSSPHLGGANRQDLISQCLALTEQAIFESENLEPPDLARVEAIVRYGWVGTHYNTNDAAEMILVSRT